MKSLPEIAGYSWRSLAVGDEALLQVNQDNPQARALYEGLSFTKVKTLYAYRKELGRSA